MLSWQEIFLSCKIFPLTILNGNTSLLNPGDVAAQLILNTDFHYCPKEIFEEFNALFLACLAQCKYQGVLLLERKKAKWMTWYKMAGIAKKLSIDAALYAK